jgi:transcriptional regulator with XRE-family HTH domain
VDEFAEHVAGQFGRRLRRRRRALDLSQEAVAERTGIHRTQMTLYEKGERVPRAATLIKLAAALDVSVSQLLVGVGWEPAGPRPGRPDRGDPDG